MEINVAEVWTQKQRLCHRYYDFDVSDIVLRASMAPFENTWRICERHVTEAKTWISIVDGCCRAVVSHQTKSLDVRQSVIRKRHFGAWLVTRSLGA